MSHDSAIKRDTQYANPFIVAGGVSLVALTSVAIGTLALVGYYMPHSYVYGMGRALKVGGATSLIGFGVALPIALIILNAIQYKRHASEKKNMTSPLDLAEANKNLTLEIQQLEENKTKERKTFSQNINSILNSDLNATFINVGEKECYVLSDGFKRVCQLEVVEDHPEDAHKPYIVKNQKDRIYIEQNDFILLSQLSRYYMKIFHKCGHTDYQSEAQRIERAFEKEKNRATDCGGKSAFLMNLSETQLVSNCPEIREREIALFYKVSHDYDVLIPVVREDLEESYTPRITIAEMDKFLVKGAEETNISKIYIEDYSSITHADLSTEVFSPFHARKSNNVFWPLDFLYNNTCITRTQNLRLSNDIPSEGIICCSYTPPSINSLLSMELIYTHPTNGKYIVIDVRHISFLDESSLPTKPIILQQDNGMLKLYMTRHEEGKEVTQNTLNEHFKTLWEHAEKADTFKFCPLPENLPSFTSLSELSDQNTKDITPIMLNSERGYAYTTFDQGVIFLPTRAWIGERHHYYVNPNSPYTIASTWGCTYSIFDRKNLCAGLQELAIGHECLRPDYIYTTIADLQRLAIGYEDSIGSSIDPCPITPHLL